MTSKSPTASSGLASLANGVVLSPFTQLRHLLGTTPAGHADPIDLTIGEPREAMPAFVVDKLVEAASSYANYPPIRAPPSCATPSRLGRDAATVLLPPSTLSAKFCP